LTAAAGQAQVYSSSPALSINDNTVQDTLSVSGGPTITDLNVLLDITHTWAADVDIILVPPSGNVYIHLTSDNGGSGDNYQVTRFDQQAFELITSGTAPFDGDFIPEGGDVTWGGDIALPGASLADLSALNGLDANGTWTLIIDDDAGGDTGTLNYWSIEVNGAVDDYGPSTPPSGTGTASPDVAITGDEVTFTVTTEGGANPDADITSVTIDLSPLGGSDAEILFDDGTNGDTTAADGVYTLSYTLSASNTRGAFELDFIITDAESRTATGTIELDVEATPGDDQYSEVDTDAGDTIETAAVLDGDGALNAIFGTLASADSDIFAINICDPANFTATTFPAVAGGITDSQLFLFDSNGMGIAHNDDIPDGSEGDATALSRLTSSFVASLPAGTYYLAVTAYNRDPVDAGGALLWANTPFNTERAPGGPGASNAFAGWIGSPSASGRYTLNLTGVCFGEGGGPSCPGCAADYDQDGGITGADIAAFFADFEAGAQCADVDQDGGVTGADIGAFFVVYEAGGC
jgi:subtilisin-like proprotein convertase family protein